ncbi:MAG: hypothetical protein AAGE52_41240 [Myxococcota bacterium]
MPSKGMRVRILILLGLLLGLGRLVMGGLDTLRDDGPSIHTHSEEPTRAIKRLDRDR